ncbi:claudin-8-like [Elgaria multicarinata webbii]|uniref:claudin-8-like n=1 Tax=Elgaria multicarinata webbii TaxID=159646 RepID=UPI002FCCC469
MECRALQTAALVLGSIGLAGTFTATLMPQWKVSAFTGSSIIVFETIWEGLWMVCVNHINKHQCKVYESVLALPTNLDVSRGLMCTACAFSVLALLLSIVGMKCTRCPGIDEQKKSKFLLSAGVFFLLTGLMVLIPVSLVADNIIKEFHSPVIQASQKRELGAALYLGWVTSAFLICAGALFCQSCHCAAEAEPRSDRNSLTARKPELIRMEPLTVHSYI